MDSSIAYNGLPWNDVRVNEPSVSSLYFKLPASLITSSPLYVKTQQLLPTSFPAPSISIRSWSSPFAAEAAAPAADVPAAVRGISRRRRGPVRGQMRRGPGIFRKVGCEGLEQPEIKLHASVRKGESQSCSSTAQPRSVFTSMILVSLRCHPHPDRFTNDCCYWQLLLARRR